MNERSLRALQAHRATLLSQWEERLRARPANSPLAHPDTLVHLMDRTLDQVFHDLTNQVSARRRQPALPDDFCRCGHNPLVAYFSTAALAFQTALAQCADETPITRDDVEAVNRTLTRIARREITTFCALCQRHADYPTPEESPSQSHDPHTPTA
ncbi:MAG: hypothetical protein WC205_01855 [Opitutaceae bacterium]